MGILEGACNPGSTVYHEDEYIKILISVVAWDNK